MAIIKCKMCGGDLTLVEGSTVCECEYCGTRQTVPSADNEKKMTLFARAGRLLRACEFDKAAGVFETIVAGFPEEAEAYWGLVLCKYGIEYVDDPATGKKIPTCHRSSFDSVLDDPNFEQACENTDAIARRVYRDEARQIEELRRRVIEVSGREEPYDVFISYKETDENGERTLDSVIAQDIYTELTGRDYRVFFSRISLEDKLGTEYEPYIFAALNSAKLMLVVGTDYENFDAVWVKNEWSRFLRLIAAGQKKTLIPVFKNMDAYDMPKEFSKLAAQDMGKVGAMQDLVRGVGKIVGKKGGTTPTQPVQQVVQQTVVQGGGPNVTALLKRGQQALEDGEWEKAREYFERVLDMDAECAEAFLGKFCVQERAVSLDAALFSRLSKSDQLVLEQKEIDFDTQSFENLIERSIICGYLDRAEIENRIGYNQSALHERFCYASNVAHCAAMNKEALENLNADKNFGRARRYALGETAFKINIAIQSFERELGVRLKKSQREEDEARKRKQNEYIAFLERVEKEIAELCRNAEAARDSDYQEACKKMYASADEDTLVECIHSFEQLSDYKNSSDCIMQCQKIIADIKEKELKKATEIAGRVKGSRLTKYLIAAGYTHSVGLNYDGTVCAVGDNDFDQCRVNAWNDIVQVCTGSFHTLGLEADGTVLSCGWNLDGQCNVSEWKECIDIAAGDNHSLGLLINGNVIACGNNESKQCEVDHWTGIMAIAAGKSHSLGLKADGTVVSAGDNRCSQCDVSAWREIKAIDAGDYFSVGLKFDGTVVVATTMAYAQSVFGGWTDIISISAGADNIVGVKKDGTVLSVIIGEEEDSSGKCRVSDWCDIISVAAGGLHTLGLKESGEVVATVYSGDENRNYGQCTVSSWKLFGSMDELFSKAELENENLLSEFEKRIASLKEQKQKLQVELSNVKGLFSERKKERIETKIAEIDEYLKDLKSGALYHANYQM